MDRGTSTDTVSRDEKALVTRSHGAFEVVATQSCTPGQTGDTSQILRPAASAPVELEPT